MIYKMLCGIKSSWTCCKTKQLFEQRKGLYTNKIIYDIATRARTIENEHNLPDPTTAIFVLLDSDLTSDELLKMQCLEAATSSLALAKKVLYI